MLFVHKCRVCVCVYVQAHIHKIRIAVRYSMFRFNFIRWYSSLNTVRVECSDQLCFLSVSYLFKSFPILSIECLIIWIFNLKYILLIPLSDTYIYLRNEISLWVTVELSYVHFMDKLNVNAVTLTHLSFL